MNKSAFTNKIEEGWLDELWPFLSSEKMVSNFKVIKGRKTFNIVVPEVDVCFNAFKLTPLKDTRVVIFGDGPYLKDHNDGLAFSSSCSHHCPEPLAEMLLEVQDDCYNGMNLDRGVNYSLEGWAKQGVLLLNTKLTTEKTKDHSEYWDDFTKYVIQVADQTPGTIFVFFGENKGWMSSVQNGYILVAPKIRESKIFSRINEIIKDQNGEGYCIDWGI